MGSKGYQTGAHVVFKVKHSPGDAGGFGPQPLPLSATKG
jgi:hypothetical protein